MLKINGFEVDKLNDDAYAQIYKTFPVYDWFVVDDQNRIWVAVNTEGRQHYSLRVFDEQGDLIAKTPFPKSVELQVIRDGYAYGIREAESGEQSVVRYEIKNN